jgi:hypothetical protein
MVMSYFQNVFQSTNAFLPETDIPQQSDLAKQLRLFDIPTASNIRLIDTSHDISDIRLNYIIDNKWVLRFCNPESITEERLEELHRLIERYRAIDILCPQLLTDPLGNFIHKWKDLVCYLSEYIDMPLASEVNLANEEELLSQIHRSVAHFAQTYKNVDLSDTMGMYSLFQLSPFDIPGGIDEKEENFNQLINLLIDENENSLAQCLTNRYREIRKELEAVYLELPRCVFQGDENFSNILIDEKQHFRGFIDFNLAGTEVIVNQLANIVGFDYAENDKHNIGAKFRLDYAVDRFNKEMSEMLHIYRATQEEIRAMRLYAWIVMVAQWPILCYFRYCLKSPLRDEFIELLWLIAELPEHRLLDDK